MHKLILEAVQELAADLKKLHKASSSSNNGDEEEQEDPRFHPPLVKGRPGEPPRHLLLGKAEQDEEGKEVLETDIPVTESVSISSTELRKFVRAAVKKNS